MASAIAVRNGLVAVGHHRADATTGLPKGNAVPGGGAPLWGRLTPTGETALVGRLLFDNGANPPRPCALRRCPP